MIGTVLYVLSRDTYDLVEDFKWMFEVLCLLAEAKTVAHEARLSGIMLDVITRVEELAEDVADIVLAVLEKFESLKSERCELLAVLWFIAGEAASKLHDDKAALAVKLLTNERWGKLDFPEAVLNAMASAAFKLTVRYLDQDKQSEVEELLGCMKLMQTSSKYIEVQERCTLYTQLLKSNPQVAHLKSCLVPLQPVHPGAQGLISLPEGLSAPIEVKESELLTRKEDGSVEYHYFREDDVASHEDLMKEAKARLKQKSKDPFYLKETKPRRRRRKAEETKTEETKEEEVPVVVEVRVPEVSQSRTYKVNRGAALPS
jgi:hypothetical protein